MVVRADDPGCAVGLGEDACLGDDDAEFTDGWESGAVAAHAAPSDGPSGDRWQQGCLVSGCDDRFVVRIRRCARRHGRRRWALYLCRSRIIVGRGDRAGASHGRDGMAGSMTTKAMLRPSMTSTMA